MSSEFKVIQIPVGSMANFTYIIADPKSSQAAIIDPSWELEKVFEALNKNSFHTRYIINTHAHFDHILGNEQVAAITGAKIIQHISSENFKDISVQDGDNILIGSLELKVIHTPGHSKESMCLLVDKRALFTGDTLFVGNCGRTDLPGSDPAEMYDSLFQRLAVLEKSITIYPGHNYGNEPTSTIEYELKTNPVLRPRTKAQFINLMTNGE